MEEDHKNDHNADRPIIFRDSALNSSFERELLQRTEHTHADGDGR